MTALQLRSHEVFGREMIGRKRAVANRVNRTKKKAEMSSSLNVNKINSSWENLNGQRPGDDPGLQNESYKTRFATFCEDDIFMYDILCSGLETLFSYGLHVRV